MPGTLVIRNQQRTQRVNVRLLDRICRAVLEEALESENYDLAIHLVTTQRITWFNEQFLHHAGPTDVIALDYSDRASRFTNHALALHGEIFICIAQAEAQAPKFRTTWQAEVARYIIHGILHLIGYDDQRASQRRRMKRREDTLLGAVKRRFPLSRLGTRPKLRQ